MRGHLTTRARVLAAAFPLVFCAHSSATDLQTRIDQVVRSMPESYQGVVLVAKGDNVLFARGYGLAERSNGVVNRPETRFLVGSISKQFTAVLALRLAQLGLVKLDAPILKYVPEYPRANGERITVRHLLSHRSGIPHHAQGIPRYFEVVDRLFYTPREYMALFWNRPLLSEPGAAFNYSSPGYTLLGIVLENATGRSYAELLREHILTPLALAHTSIDNNLTVNPAMAAGYRRGLRGLVQARHEEESTRGAAGSILTTAGDLARFQRVLSRSGDAVLDGTSKALLLEKHSPNHAFAGSVLSVPYPDRQKVLTIISHGGSSYGFAARVDRLIEEDACIIALSNNQDADLGAMFDRVGDVVLEEIGFRPRKAEAPQAPPADRPVVPAATPAAYEGFYALGDGNFLGVVRKGGAIRRLWFNAVSSEVRISVLNAGQQTSAGTRINSTGDGRLSQYEGLYYSPELQTTYRFARRAGDLVASQFLGSEDAHLTLLRDDLLGCTEGFLAMERSQDGTIRGFWLRTGTTSSYFVRR